MSTLLATTRRFRSRSILAAAVAILFLLFGVTSALADQFLNNIDGSADTTREVLVLSTANGSTTIAVSPTGGDGKPGCNITGSTSVTVSITSTNTSVASVSPTSNVFNSCGETLLLTVTPFASGTANVNFAVTANNTGGSFTTSTADFSILVDNLPPTIAITIPSEGATYIQNATVATSFSCNDTGGSGLVSCIGASTLDTSTLGPRTFVVTAADGAGNTASTTVNYTVIPANTPPTVTISGVSHGATYNKGAVPAAVCNVVDAQDGNSSFAATLSAITGTYASDGIGSQTASCSYTDAGGLNAAASATYSIIDPSAPIISYVLTPSTPDGNNGWYRGNVTLVWTVSEPQSPNSLAKTGCVDQSITADQGATTYSCSATSAGGSASQVDVTIKRDGGDPDIDVSFDRSPEYDPPGGNNAWFRDTVTISFTCTDALSGVASSPDPITVNTHGTTSYEVTCTDNAGNAKTLSRSVNVDTSNPVLTASATAGGNPYSAGVWTNQTVVVDFDCTDTGSGVAAGNPTPDPVTKNLEGNNQSASSTCADNVGHQVSETFAPIRIDTTKPIITGSRAPDANANGWNNTDVTVDFDCTDALSGVDEDTVAGETLTGDGADQSVTNGGVCTDHAGNVADAATVNGINIDKSAPTITGSRTPDPNTNGWNNSPVTVSFACDDALSGVESCSDVTILSDEGTGQSVTGTAVDKAGNSAQDTVDDINIDTTPPTIAFVSATTGGADYTAGAWTNQDVVVTWSCADDLSGPTTSSVSDTKSDEGADQTASGTCTDLAGNSAGADFGPINIDKTAPTIVGSRDPLANANGWNNTDVDVTFACADDLSGITSCIGDTTVSAEGANQTVSGTATDNAGNTASDAVNGISIDKSAPEITFTLGGTLGENGWYVSDVDVTFTCADTGLVQSGLDVDSASGTTTVSSEGADQAVPSTGSCTDKAGNAAAGVEATVSIDKTSPTIVVFSRLPAANANGWNNSAVTVTFDCTDAVPGSGVATFTDPITFDADVADGSATGDCEDNAGLTDSVTEEPIKIDTVKPVIIGEITGGTLGANGWYVTDVEVAFTCADNAGSVNSGLDTNTADGTTTVSDEGADLSVSNSGACTDKAGNVADPATVSGIDIDKTKPVITSSRTPDANANGWNNTDVKVDFGCEEAGSAGSGIAFDTVADATLTNEGADQSVTNSGDCVDEAGNAASPETIGGINIDKSAPTFDCDDPDGLWYAADVSLGCTADGSISGLANAADASFDLTTSVSAGTETDDAATNSRLVCDNADNCATAGPIAGNMIDKKAPSVYCDDADTIWHNDNVSFTCSADDGGSGVSDPDSTVLSTSVAAGTENPSASTGSHTFFDNVGNSATAGPIGGNKIDRKAPTVSCGAADGLWHNDNVSIACTASDGGAGLENTADASFNLTTSVPLGTETSNASTNSRSIGDAVGNASLAGPIGGNKVDKKRPTTIAFVGAITNGVSYPFGSVPAAPTCTAQDGGSGLKDCVVTGYGTGVGSHTLTATARDNVLNSDTTTISFTVAAWTIAGFHQPVDGSALGAATTATVWNTSKNGSTVPLKFEVFAGATELTSTSAITSFTIQQLPAPGTTSGAYDEIELYSTGGTSLRYDATGGQFIQNWQTPKKAGTYWRVTVTLADGTKLSAFFYLK